MIKSGEQLGLIRHLSRMGSQGRAEGEDKDAFPRTFHPVPEHARAFDPDVVLVVGPRGAGKSELFRAVIELGLLKAIARHAPHVRLPSTEKTKWMPGFPIGTGFPDFRGLIRYIEARPGQTALSELWFTYLSRVLYGRLDEKGKASLANLIRQEGGDPFRNHDFFKRAEEAPLLALDRLDAELESQDERIFVGYDELDTLGGEEWDAMNKAVRGLVGFWATYTRRWRRIRAKIFLRTDLYHRVGAVGGADLAKLSANRAEITWSDQNLYAMLVKRIANSSDELTDYAEQANLRFVQDPELGNVPFSNHVQSARPFIERIAGPYMGANVKKGLTYRWLLEHIRDGIGHALPRPLVRLVEAAAAIQVDSPQHPRWPRLLTSASLRRAVDQVSREHFRQSLAEWPWLEVLSTTLKGEQVPWERRHVERLLDKAMANPEGKEKSLPASSAREFVDYLVEVGIFRPRSDGRIDVPDLFLAGFGLKRKGGVRQR